MAVTDSFKSYCYNEKTDRPFGEGILVTTCTVSELRRTVYTAVLPFPLQFTSGLLKHETVSESKFPGVNQHITIQGHQQNAAESIWKLINVNRPNLHRKLHVNEAQVAETNDWRTAALRLQSQNQITAPYCTQQAAKCVFRRQ